MRVVSTSRFAVVYLIDLYHHVPWGRSETQWEWGGGGGGGGGERVGGKEASHYSPPQRGG